MRSKKFLLWLLPRQITVVVLILHLRSESSVEVMNPRRLLRKRRLKILRLPRENYRICPWFCKKRAPLRWLRLIISKLLNWLILVVLSSNFLDISFKRSSIASWPVLSFVKAVARVFVTEGPISINATITVICLTEIVNG